MGRWLLCTVRIYHAALAGVATLVNCKVLLVHIVMDLGRPRRSPLLPVHQMLLGSPVSWIDQPGIGYFDDRVQTFRGLGGLAHLRVTISRPHGRMLETEGKQTTTKLQLPHMTITKAHRTNVVEENISELSFAEHSISVPLKAYGITTIRLHTSY